MTTRFELDLTEPKLMGIVNITPDSFSDGGRTDAAAAIAHAEQLVKDGADLLDLGAESSRPGSKPIALEEELHRLMPVLKAAVSLGVAISVDTCKPQVMRAALDVGADIVNDIWALRQPGSVEVVAQHPRCGIVLMHMHGEPSTMQVQPMEGKVTSQVLQFWEQQTQWIQGQGVDFSRICVDPGIGFGKTVSQNFEILANQQDLLHAGLPLLVGWSRKSSLGAVTGLDLSDRLVPSIAAALLAAERGARVLRVHDVRDTRQALKVWTAARR